MVMRALPIAAITVVVSALSGIQPAAAGTWCAQLNVPPGAVQCSFYSLEQCQATVRGIGGFCAPNAFAYSGGIREPRRRHRHHY